MNPTSSQSLVLAELVLAVHVAIIGFNVFWLIAIPVGAWRRWSFARAPLWRWLHLASLAVVALQAIAGRACFLTNWQERLSGVQVSQPLIMRWVNSMVFWPLPIWMFNALYLAAFAYTLLLFWLVPPRRR